LGSPRDGRSRRRTVDLGVVGVGDIGYSCGTGMYGGVIKIVDA